MQRLAAGNYFKQFYMTILCNSQYNF